MDFEWNQIIRAVVGLFAIVNPIGAAPIFVALTSGRDLDTHQIVKSCAIAVAITLLISAFFGRAILGFFGISIPAFQVGGGLLILTMGLTMLNAKNPRAKHRDEEAEEAQTKESISVVPLAIPLLSGPGAISLVIVEAESASGNWILMLSLVLAILLVAGSVYATLLLAPRLAKRLGQTGINIFTRVMGLLITAIAVEFITKGLSRIFPGLLL